MRCMRRLHFTTKTELRVTCHSSPSPGYKRSGFCKTGLDVYMSTQNKYFSIPNGILMVSGFNVEPILGFVNQQQRKNKFKIQKNRNIPFYYKLHWQPTRFSTSLPKVDIKHTVFQNTRRHLKVQYFIVLQVMQSSMSRSISLADAKAYSGSLKKVSATTWICHQKDESTIAILLIDD